MVPEAVLTKVHLMYAGLQWGEVCPVVSKLEMVERVMSTPRRTAGMTPPGLSWHWHGARLLRAGCVVNPLCGVYQ